MPVSTRSHENEERQPIKMPTKPSHVPVTILTGFLGSGKTTLLNHILTATHGKKIAVIENEFGDVSIDDKLLAKNTTFETEEDIVEVLNGCICCTVRQDLVQVIHKLAERTRRGKLFLDAIVIETTGMADPAPVVQTFLVDEIAKEFARIDGVLCLVDALHIEQHLNEQKPDGVVNEAVVQTAFADRILLNKVDLVDDEKHLERIENSLRTINSFAPIERCKHANISVDRVLAIDGCDLQRLLQVKPGLLDLNSPPTKHDDTVSSVSLNQGAPRHLRTVKKGDLDLELTQRWIDELIHEQGQDLFRMKGVLSIAHATHKFVYHSVHMTFDGSFTEPWGDEPRESKMVFIGKNLQDSALAERFNGCIATSKVYDERAASLRFSVNDKVKCNVGKKWIKGKVVQLMYRDDNMPQGLIAPYQVELEDGSLIWAPSDVDCVIRKAK
ncbi:MAG: hypothetical protein SGPRY_006381 [Prymnesium sp.]